MKKIIIYVLFLLMLPTGILAQTIRTVGTSGGYYQTLYDAFFDINNGIIDGEIILQLIDNTTESSTAELFENGYSSPGYTSITIYPTSTGLSISGEIDGPLINLNGATNVTFDGRVNATGLTPDLIITNTSTGTSASTIQFINDASNNIIKYCTIQGSSTNTTGGVIFFSSSGTVTGNDGNTIDLNNITSDPAGRPVNAIYSEGTTGLTNSGNTVSNNLIYDFFTPSLLVNGTSNGINISANSTAWTISGNSFYETTSFAPSGTPTVTYNAISIINTGTNYSITGNFIGGSSSSCSGIWTKTSAKNNIFYGIYLNVGTGTASSVQNNTIKNFNWANSLNATWTGIYIAGGDVNIGTAIGNIIGSGTGTGSVTVNSGTAGAFVYGINIAGTGTVNCQKNTIGSVTTSSGPANSFNFIGINKTAAGTTTINNNIIGSLTQANSIQASSASTSNAQSVVGISNAGSGNITISGNDIVNITNTTTNSDEGTAGLINGIKSTNGTNTISNNTIRDLTISNANISTSNTASVCGIALTNTTLKTISGNTIYNLSNTFSSFKGSVTGIYFTGSTGANIVSENFIHSLTSTGATITSPLASIYGIQIAAGAATYANNIISLGGNTPVTINGIYETGAAANNNNLFFNSVYINGTPASGAGNSYALYSAVTTNTRDFRNNILNNARSNGGATGKHYSIYITTAGGTITTDFNDYFISGSGGVLGYLAGDIANLGAWQIATGQDVNSLATTPSFANAGGTSPEDYIPAALLTAVAGTGIVNDFNGATRVAPLTMGAFEGGSCSNPTSGGTIATAQGGCIPYDPTAFTSTSPASGYTGATLEYKWQESVTSAVAGFSDIAASNSLTYNPGALSQTTWYKRLARVSCIGAGDWTGAAASNVLEVTINALPAIGLTVGGANEVCNGTGTNITVALSESGVNYQLRNGVTNVGTPVAGTSGTINLPTGNLFSTTTFNVLATNIVTTCSVQLTQTKAVTVNSLPNAGLVVGGNTTICSGTSTNITVALSQTGVNYQLRNDNADELVGPPVAGDGGTIILPTGAMTFNILYNVLATNGTTGCSAELTDKELVNIYPPSNGGTINGTSSITYGSSSGTMTLTGYTGTIQRWEKRYNSGSWTTIANTTTTYSETPVPAGTWGYRAVVKSGTCNEANSDEFSITVNPKALTITAENKSKNYGAVLPLLTFTYTGLVNGDVATSTPPTLNTTATAASPAGTYPITASGAADPNYTISYVAGILTVDKVPLTITADNKSKNYGAALPTLTVTYTGLVNGDLAAATPPSINTTATAASPAGIYPITASGAIDPNYTINYVAGTLTVDKVPLTITADNKSKNYGTALPSLTVTYTGLVNSDISPATPPAITTTAIASSPAGNYPITASGAADPNYNLSYVAGTLTINKVDQTILFSSLPNKIYGDGDFTLSAVAGSLLLVTFASSNPAVATVTGNTVHIVGAGSTTITASQAGDINYNAAPDVPQSLTVSKAAQTITFDPLLDKTFGVADYNLFATASSGLTVSYVSSNPAVATITGSVVHVTGVGTTTITASQGGNANYNPSPDVPQTLNVFTANATVILGNLTTTYNGLPQAATATTSPAGLTVDFTYDGSAIIPVDAGSYTVAASINDGSYHGNAAGTMVINKADQTITFEALLEKEYGTADYTLFATASSGLTVSYASSNPAVASVTGNVVHVIAVGTTTITASQNGDANYNPASDVPQTLNVIKATATVTLGNLTTTYNGLAQTATATTSPAGLTVEITYNGSATIPINAGSYNVAASINDVSYHGSAAGTMVISKADQTISFVPLAVKTYGDSDFTLSAGAGSLLLVGFTSSNPAVATVSGNSVHIVGAGSTIITASQVGDANYNAAPDVPQTLTVNKANQTITFAPLTNKTFGENDFTLSASAGSSLLVTFASSNTSIATVTGSTVHIVGAGTTTITASQAGNTNYNAAPAVLQTLTVNMATQNITFNLAVDKLLVGDELNLVATSTSGLTVLFESNDITLATVTSDVLKGVSKGTVVIRAYHPGDLNYFGAEKLASIEIYSTHKEVLHLFTPNNDGFNDYWELTELAAWGKCDVRVFNRWGKLVFANPDYNNLWDGMSNGSPVPEGAYYFIIDTENVGVMKGTVNIVR